MKGCDQAITRDPYNFDFIELTVDHNEREMKEALLQNVQRLLVEKLKEMVW
ncbi:MAG: DUF1016 family protein [Proteobacteria bacterium]|nr:DUF1016 family protein [Pseudomonadota bacterium]